MGVSVNKGGLLRNNKVCGVEEQLQCCLDSLQLTRRHWDRCHVNKVFSSLPGEPFWAGSHPTTVLLSSLDPYFTVPYSNHKLPLCLIPSFGPWWPERKTMIRIHWTGCLERANNDQKGNAANLASPACSTLAFVLRPHLHWFHIILIRSAQWVWWSKEYKGK